MTLFGDRTFKEVIKVKQGQKSEALIQQDWYPDKGGRDTRDSFSTHMQWGKAMWGHGEKPADYKPGREVSPETNPDGTLILEF